MNGFESMVYKWNNTPTAKIEAQAAGEELERIRKARMSLRPHIIEEESRSESAVLHECFDWNDKSAALSWRHQQARQLVNNLVTVEIKEQKLSEPVRAFIHLKDSKEYMPINVVVQTKNYMEQMMDSAKRDYEIFRRKYSVLNELSEFFNMGHMFFED